MKVPITIRVALRDHDNSWRVDVSQLVEEVQQNLLSYGACDLRLVHSDRVSWHGRCPTTLDFKCEGYQMRVAFSPEPKRKDTVAVGVFLADILLSEPQFDRSQQILREVSASTVRTVMASINRRIEGVTTTDFWLQEIVDIRQAADGSTEAD